MGERWRALKGWQRWTLGGIALVLVILAIPGGGDKQGATDRATRTPVSKASIVEASPPAPASATPVPVEVAASFRLPHDGAGVFSTRTSHAVVSGRVRPARREVLRWQLVKVPGARLIDKGSVTTSATGRFSFVVLGVQPGEHRLVISGRNVANTASLAIARKRSRPRPVATPEPTSSPTPAPTATPQSSNCDPSYTGACLDPNSPDYDCAGGSGNGPDYTGVVRVVGPDHFDLDRDGDGIGCDT